MPTAASLLSPRGRRRAQGPPLEHALLRRSVGTAEARHHRCADCHRTPLVGELVHRYGERLVCELCRPLRREPPARSELMLAPDQERSVRVQRR